MHEMILFTGAVVMGFFAIMNPIANTPIFMGITASIEDRKQKNKIAFMSTLIAFIIVAAFTILGQFIFKMFGITLPAFQITGGILLFVIGYDLLQGKSSSFHHSSSTDHEKLREKAADPDTVNSIALTPLGIPILALDEEKPAAGVVVAVIHRWIRDLPSTSTDRRGVAEDHDFGCVRAE